MDLDRTTRLEEQVAHLTRVLEDLSETVARQEAAIGQMQRRIAMLVEREAEREADAGAAIPLADQRPPHW